MFEAPLDAWYVWLGLAAVSATAVGVVAGLPAAPPPDAAGAAETVDRIAASDHGTVAERPLPNTAAIRVGTDTLSLRGPGGTTHATVGYGPVTPAAANDSLAAVLRGTPPERAFDTPSHLTAAAAAARSRRPTWTETDRLVVRRVRWEGTDVVLVG
jgi:hypothetical protein